MDVVRLEELSTELVDKPVIQNNVQLPVHWILHLNNKQLLDELVSLKFVNGRTGSSQIRKPFAPCYSIKIKIIAMSENTITASNEHQFAYSSLTIYKIPSQSHSLSRSRSRSPSHSLSPNPKLHNHYQLMNYKWNILQIQVPARVHGNLFILTIQVQLRRQKQVSRMSGYLVAIVMVHIIRYKTIEI